MNAVSPGAEAVAAHPQAGGVSPEPLLEPVCAGFTRIGTFRGELLSTLYQDLWDTATKPNTSIMEDMSIRHIDALANTTVEAGAVAIVRKALCIEQISVLTILGSSEILRHEQKSSHKSKGGPDLALGFQSALTQIMEMLRISDQDIQMHIGRIARRKRTGRALGVHHNARLVPPDLPES